jgi:hypothetical protein
VFLDQVGFKRERFDFVVGDDEIDVFNARDQIAGPENVCAIGVKILADPVAKVLRLADVDYLSVLVTVEVATRLGG